MMKLNRIVLAALAAASLSAPALAVDYNYGDVTGRATSGAIYIDSSGSFIDYHFFNVTTPVNAYGVISDIQFGTLLNIDSLVVEEFADGGTPGVVDSGDVYLGPLGTGDLISATGFIPSAGSYYLRVTGTATGMGFNLDGTDPGNEYGAYFFNASTAPVPEPETWAMIAAGLGLVGLRIRRRARGQAING